jgi:hypothetical protein
MKVKNRVLKNVCLTTAEFISQTRKITLDEDGFVSETLNEDQRNALAEIPDFIVCDDEGVPVKQEKKVLVVDEQKTGSEDITKLLAANTELEAKVRQLDLVKTELEETVENLKIENEELKAQLNIKQSSDTEEGKKNEGEQLVLGQKKLEDGKAWIVKEDGKGGLVWRRDKENDPK